MYMEMCSLNVFCIFELKTSEIPVRDLRARTRYRRRALTGRLSPRVNWSSGHRSVH